MAHSGKTITFATDLLPNEDNIYSLGSSSKKWKIFGDVSGNADTATTATNLANNPSILAGTSNTNKVTITAGGKTSSEYTIPYATNAGTADIATNANYQKYYFHDLLGFCYIATPTYETTTDGSTWTTGTLDKLIFDLKNRTGIALFSNNIKGHRWTWNSNLFQYSSGSYVVMSWGYTNPSAKKQVIVESSTDGTSWTEIGRAENTWGSLSYTFPISSYGAASWIRITISKTSDSGTGSLRNLRLISQRSGDLGLGIEYEYPYDWDDSKNITLSGNLYVSGTHDIGSSNTKWNNVYANNFKGTSDVALKLSNTTAIGSNVNPVYFTNGGVPQATATEMLRGFTTTSAGTDLNTMYDSGMYSLPGGSITNYPTGGDRFATILTVAYRKPSGNTKPDYAWLMGNFTQNTNRMWYRTSSANAWNSWRLIVNIATNTGVGGETTPIYVNANGEVMAGTALQALAYKASLETSDIPDLSGTYATNTTVNGLLAALDAMIFKGTLGTGGTITALPATHNAGDTYRVITAGTWAGKTCVVGDLIICIKDGTTAADADWTSVETNEDGAVIGPATASSTTNNAIVRWDSTTGRTIKNSSTTIDDNGNIIFPSTASASMFPSHYYTQLYDSNGNTYVHYYTTNASSTYSYANLRVKNGSSFKTLRFGGDGTFTWGGNTVLTSDNTSTGTNNNATLAWNTTYTIAKINGTDIKFTTMAKPTYTASDIGAATSTHTHGNITNDGKIGTTNNLVVTSSGAVSVGAALSASISSLTLSTKFLREDGSFAAPSYVFELMSRSASTLKTTAGNFVFYGNNLFPEITSSSTDWIGIQLGYKSDRWQLAGVTSSDVNVLPTLQLTGISNHLYFRENDNASVTANNWNATVCLLDSGMLSSAYTIAEGDSLVIKSAANNFLVKKSSITFSAAVETLTSSTKFLREDGTWSAPSQPSSFTITANATDGLWDLTGTSGSNAVTYAVGAYSAKQTNASFYTAATNPTLTTRLNYDGYFYATKLYSGGTEVSVSGHTHSYLPLSGGNLTGTLGIKPASGEGGELHLKASTEETDDAGIVLDNYHGVFRIFGIASADGTTVTGTGSPLYIDPYAKTITGGYTITGTLSGNATSSSKIAAKLATTTKTTLLGVSAATTLSGTATNVELIGDTGIYLTTTVGEISALRYSIHDSSATPVEKARLEWNSTDQAIEFIFA